jgi:hypothetical protein
MSAANELGIANNLCSMERAPEYGHYKHEEHNRALTGRAAMPVKKSVLKMSLALGIMSVIVTGSALPSRAQGLGLHTSAARAEFFQPG